jgi:PAS domain-containing protein
MKEGLAMDLSETLFQGVANATSLGIFTTDDQLTITGWNHWLETSSGLQAAQTIGRNLLEVFPELLKRKLDRCYRQAASGQLVLLAQGLHGHLLSFPPSVEESGLGQMQQSARIAPIVENDRIVGTITIIEDVTERCKRSPEKLEILKNWRS